MTPSPLDPREAEARFGAMLDEAGLPRFAHVCHHPEIDLLELTWSHGFSLHIDLTFGELEPLDDWERCAIRGLEPLGFVPSEPVHAATERWTTARKPPAS